MSLTENFKWKVLESMFAKRGFVHHQLSSYNDFIHMGIERVVHECMIEVDTTNFKYSVSFGEVYVPPPTLAEDDRRRTYTVYPNEARLKDLTYDTPIFVTLTETYAPEGEPVVRTVHNRIPICRIPVMLLSSICNLSALTTSERVQQGECEWEHGGYFIVRGKERVLVGQLRGIYNQPIVVSAQKKSSDKYKYACEIRSMSEETGHSVQIIVKLGVNDRTIVFVLPYIKELVPAGVLFKALGYETEDEIAELIGDRTGNLAKFIKYIVRDAAFVETRRDALCWLGQFPERVIKDDERLGYATQVVENELFPHMGISVSLREKAYLLGDMVNKLLRTSIGERNCDDRDSYINKRVEMSGVLCCDLFRTLFKKFTKTLQCSIEKKKQKPDLISMISRNTDITTGIRRAFATGAWGVPKANYIKTGVSQVLMRLSYGSSLSHLRRVVIQMGKDGKNVSVKIRQPHSSQIFYICPAETPEVSVALDVFIIFIPKISHIFFIGSTNRSRSESCIVSYYYISYSYRSHQGNY